jgi:hypothetical protein
MLPATRRLGANLDLISSSILACIHTSELLDETRKKLATRALVPTMVRHQENLRGRLESKPLH